MVGMENVAHQYVTKIINFIKNLTANPHIIFACLQKELIGRLENSFRIVPQPTKFKFLDDSVRPVGNVEDSVHVWRVLQGCIDLKMTLCANCAQKVCILISLGQLDVLDARCTTRPEVWVPEGLPSVIIIGQLHGRAF